MALPVIKPPKSVPDYGMNEHIVRGLEARLLAAELRPGSAHLSINIKKAIKSVKAHPIPINSGREAKALPFIGPVIAEMIQEDLNKAINPVTGRIGLPPQFEQSILGAISELESSTSEDDDRLHMTPAKPVIAPQALPPSKRTSTKSASIPPPASAPPVTYIATASIPRASTSTQTAKVAPPKRTTATSVSPPQQSTSSPTSSPPRRSPPKNAYPPSPPRRLPQPVGHEPLIEPVMTASKNRGRDTRIPVAIDDTARLRRMFNRGPYSPKVESGNWAILIALYVYTQPGITIPEPTLKQLAERFSATPMTPTGNSVFSAWSGVSRLVDEGLIIMLPGPKRYSLTLPGRELAESLWKTYNGEGDRNYGEGEITLNPEAVRIAQNARNQRGSQLIGPVDVEPPVPSRRLPLMQAQSQSMPASPSASPPRPKRAGRRKNDDVVQISNEMEDAFGPRAVGIPLPSPNSDFSGVQYLARDPHEVPEIPPRKKRAKTSAAAAPSSVAPVTSSYSQPNITTAKTTIPTSSFSQGSAIGSSTSSTTYVIPDAVVESQARALSMATSRSPTKSSSSSPTSKSPTKASPTKTTSPQSPTKPQQTTNSDPALPAPAATASNIGTQPTWRYEFYLASDPSTLPTSLRPAAEPEAAQRPAVEIPPLVSNLEFVPLSEEYLDIPLKAHVIKQVVCVVDSREKRNLGQYPQDYFQLNLQHDGVPVRTDALSVGDFAWVGIDEEDNWIMLDTIVERKAIEDWALSMMDGRLLNQKWRLRHSGLSKLYILLEGTIDPNRLNYPVQVDNITQSVSNTAFGEPAFTMLRPQDPRETGRFMTAISKFMEARYLNTTVFTTSAEAAESLKVRHHGATNFERFERCTVDDTALCWTYDQFQAYCRKTKALSGSDLFAYQLMSIFGISGTRAASIVAEWQSLPNLLASYLATPERKDRIALIGNVKVNGKKLGDAVGTLILDTLVGADM